MEGWLYGLFALLGALIGGGFSYLGIKTQLKNSDKRFEKELKRQREAESQQRRWEVRSKPLLELRNELARMATKQDKLVAAAHRLHTRFGMTEEEAKKELQEAADDWNAYVRSGNFAQTLFLQYDAELRKRAEEILREYQESYIDALYYKDLKATELGKAMEVFERNKTRIIEVQELINGRLEKL